MMESKRTPKSSPEILPKSPLVYEKCKAGCAWRLINFLDFRQGQSGKKLISDKPRRFTDSAGNVYTKSQLDLLQRLHEKRHCTNNASDQRIKEEAISCRPNKKSVQELSNREVRRKKHLKVETFHGPVQSEGKIAFSEQKQSSFTEIVKFEKTRSKHLSLEKGNDQSCKNVDPHLEKCPEINLHVCMNEALMCQKGKVFGRGKGSDQSKQFLEALDVLSSNKELFVTLFQDPSSFAAKRGQDLLGSRPKGKEAISSSKTGTFETQIEGLGESDDLDRTVHLKPTLTSLGGEDQDSAILKLKHVAKKLKHVVGSNKNGRSENKLLRTIHSPEDSCKASETERKSEAAAKRMEKTSEERESQWRSDASRSRNGRRSTEITVFKRKKRVESDVFKLSTENNVTPRRLVVEKRRERTSSLPVYEVPHGLNSLLKEMRTKERNQRPVNKKQRYRLGSVSKNVEVFDLKHGYLLRSSDECFRECLDEDTCRGSAACCSLRPDMEDECVEQRYLQSSSAESCKGIHSMMMRRTTNFSDFSSPERRNSNINAPKQEQEEHPSPVSVLARFHMEEDGTSPETAKRSSTQERIGLSSDPNIDLKSLFESVSVQEFVKIVLDTSGLNWTELLAKCTVSSLASSLLDQFSHNNDHHQRLVLDYTSEILHETFRQDIKSWPVVPLKNLRLAPLALRSDLVDRAMERFDWSLLCDSSFPRTLDQVVEKDLTERCVWADLGGETESVVIDVLDHVLEELEMEIVTELGTNAHKDI